MGYFYIILSVFANGAKGYCTKKISNVVTAVSDAVNIHLFRNMLCCIIAFVLVMLNREPDIFHMELFEFLICLFSGVSMAFFLLAWTFAIKTDAYMLVSACASASFIVPCMIGLLVLNENFTVCKVVSLLLIIAALFFLQRYNLTIKGKLSIKQILLLLVILLSQGINQTMQKLYTSFITTKSASDYTFYTFAFTFIALMVAKLFISCKNRESGQKNIVRRNLVYLIIMSVSLFGASFFQTLASKEIEAIILYPITNALSLIASSVMASTFFKEKMSKDCIAGMVLVLFALIFSKL